MAGQTHRFSGHSTHGQIRRERLAKLIACPVWIPAVPAYSAPQINLDLGLEEQSFHGRVVVLVNEHTSGAAEMLAQLVQENGLGTFVGSKTAGRLVSRSAFKIGHDYRIVFPIGAQVSWKGNRIEGKGITPYVPVDWSYEEVLHGRDNQLAAAVQIAQGWGQPAVQQGDAKVRGGGHSLGI